MDNDDIIYCILLLVSLFTGHLVKVTNDCVARQRLVSGVGVVMVIVVCRQHCLHSLLSAVVNALILLLFNARLVLVVVYTLSARAAVSVVIHLAVLFRNLLLHNDNDNDECICKARNK